MDIPSTILIPVLLTIFTCFGFGMFIIKKEDNEGDVSRIFRSLYNFLLQIVSLLLTIIFWLTWSMVEY